MYPQLPFPSTVETVWAGPCLFGSRSLRSCCLMSPAPFYILSSTPTYIANVLPWEMSFRECSHNGHSVDGLSCGSVSVWTPGSLYVGILQRLMGSRSSSASGVVSDGVVSDGVVLPPLLRGNRHSLRTTREKKRSILMAERCYWHTVSVACTSLWLSAVCVCVYVDAPRRCVLYFCCAVSE